MKHKRLRKILIFVFMLCLVFANATCFASATDPVSAATMANALAQAITAYGASQGVSMTFDVTNTNGIGEGVHDLWDQFVSDVNDPNTPTYDSLAVTMWSNLYSKIGNNLGINISASEMPLIDSFWNWLLSGPAEMSKVDNQYFEWTINEGTVSPISIYNGSPFPETLHFSNYNDVTLSNSTNGVIIYSGNDTIYRQVFSYNDPDIVYVVGINNGSSIYIRGIAKLNRSGNFAYKDFNQDGNFVPPTGTARWFTDNTTGQSYTSSFNGNAIGGGIPVFSSDREAFDTIAGWKADPYYNSISVRPYIGDSSPQNVYIPDNTDVNYNPTDVAIPLDIPWDNTLFGDGDGTLTDAQSEAAASAADDAITDSVEKTLTIADTENPDVPAPNEVYIPFLPLTLPSFNFSLSGIWHYVVTWVSSLSAWFTTMFQIWSILPYAMVVPVYATLVVVIVLGVYRRFLS